jgi:hypothetical protein
MDARDMSGDGLQLVNRLGESRSPYVSAMEPLDASRPADGHTGARAHEQPRRMADVGA